MLGLLLARLVPLAVVGGSLVAASPAGAHVTYSADATNRYLKAALLRDEARLGFTILYSGAQATLERSRMDANRDGTIDDAEARAFGARVLGELGPALVATLDGRPATAWMVNDLGLGNRAVGDEPLSLDLALVVGYPEPSAASHTLVLEDRSVVAAPGESETRFEDAPGVRIVDCQLAYQPRTAERSFAFIGNSDAAGDRAVTVRFEIAGEARRHVPARRPWWWIVAAAAVAAALATAGVAIARRSRRGE